MHRDASVGLKAKPDDRSAEIEARILDAELLCLGPRIGLGVSRKQYPGRFIHTTSFGLEGQALAHLIVESGVEAEFVTLDTGRLFPETYDVWAATEARYRIKIRACYPDMAALTALVADQGINGFRAAVGARKACCAVRKLDPLKEALLGAAVWFTGLRADQSAYRATLSFASCQKRHRIIKVNPLLDWTRDQVAILVADQDIPVSALHGRGLPSIGCAPMHAGRWSQKD